MKHLLFKGRNDWSGLIARLTLGLVLFPHGAQKVFGWFNGPGWNGEMQYLTTDAGLPWLLAVSVILIEFAGSLFLIAGLLSRVWALAIILLFTGIIFKVHLSYGFFMNWFGDQQGEGFEYHLLVIGLASTLLITGSGRYAADQAIAPTTGI